MVILVSWVLSLAPSLCQLINIVKRVEKKVYSYSSYVFFLPSYNKLPVYEVVNWGHREGTRDIALKRQPTNKVIGQLHWLIVGMCPLPICNF